MEHRLNARFGGSNIAREAARAAMQQYQSQRQADEDFDAMFQFNAQVPSGVANQPDYLVEGALQRVQGSSTQLGAGDSYPYRAEADSGNASFAFAPQPPAMPVAPAPAPQYTAGPSANTMQAAPTVAAQPAHRAASPPPDSRMPSKYQMVMAAPTVVQPAPSAPAMPQQANVAPGQQPYYLTNSPPTSPEQTLGRLRQDPDYPGRAPQHARAAAGAAARGAVGARAPAIHAPQPAARAGSPPQHQPQPQPAPTNYKNAPRVTSDIIRQARGRSPTQAPSPVTSPHNVVGIGSVMRRSATRLSSDSPRGSPSRSPSPRVGLAARISGRPASPVPAPMNVPLPPEQARAMQAQYADRRGPRQGSGGGGAGAVRPVSASLYSPPRGGGGGRAGAHSVSPSPSPPRATHQRPQQRAGQVPAWAQAGAGAGQAGGEDAGRLAQQLNGAGAPAGSPLGSPAAGGASPAGGRSPSPGSVSRSSSPGAGGWTDQGFVSASYGRQRQVDREKEAEQFRRYQLRQHRPDSPDVRYSQPRSEGPHAALAQHVYSFDEAHPAIAEQHYLRSPDQDALLQEERRRAAAKKRAQVRDAVSSRSRSRSHSPSGTPSVEALGADVARLSAVRDAGRERLRQLEEEGEGLRLSSRQVQARALDAIARAEAITRKQYGGRQYGSRSPSPGGLRRASSPGARVGVVGGMGSPSRPVTAAAYERFGVSDQRVLDEAVGAVGRAAGERPGSASAGGWWASDEEASTFRQPGPNQAHQAWPGQQQGAAPGVAPEHDAAGQTGSTGGTYEGASLADYIARDSGVRLQGDPLGPALSEAEFRMASGAFDPAKYEEYSRQMDAEAEARALERGYESDMERERMAAEAAAREAMTEEERAAAEAAARDAAQLAALLSQTWEDQNSWMDYYRQRLGPQEGYRSTQSSPGGDPGLLVGMRSPSPGASLVTQSLSGGHGSSGLGPQEEELVGSPFVPHVSDELGGYLSGGPQGHRRHARSASAPRPFTPTVPKPFTFEERAASRPKTIMRVKLEQDLQLRRQEQEAAKRYRFRASPLPHNVLEPRYERMMLEAEVRRQLSREGRMAELAGMVEKPFSFQERDEEAQVMKEAVAAAAKDPNRFQVPFHAKPLPKGVYQDKFKFMQLELEAKRAAARARMEEARLKAKQRVQEEVQQRQQVADRSYKERLRTVDPIWNQQYDTKPLGAVPDFNLLHSQWEQRLATMRALNRRHLTVPHEFGTHNARNRDELAARERKALERRQRIILDMALDSELLPEMRWPYKSPRGRVRPTPPPPLLEPDVKVSDTRANMMRRAATQSARRAGRFDDPPDKERRALERARREAQKRAKAWVELQAMLAEKKGGVGTVDLSKLNRASQATTSGGGVGLDAEIAAGGRTAGGAGGDKPPGTAARRAALADRTDAPAMHIEARHAQVEKKVREMVEDALLERGLDAYSAYKYTEG